MAKQDKELITNDIIEIKRSLHELNYSIEELTLAIKQLDETIKKEGRQQPKKPSPQIKETVTTFLEYHINPTFYQGMKYLQLKGGPPANITQPSNINNKKDEDNIDQKIDNLYILALKKAIQDFKKNV